MATSVSNRAKFVLFGLLPIALMTLWLLWQLYSRPPPFFDVDFPVWSTEWGRFVCVVHGEAGCDRLTKFSVAYLVNSFLSVLPSGEPSAQVITFVNISFVCVSLYILTRATSGEGTFYAAPAFLVALVLSSMPVYYIHSGGLELQYGILLGIYAVSMWQLMNGRGELEFKLALLITSLLLPWYKDISIVLMLAIVIVVILAKGSRFSVQEKVKTLVDSRRVWFLVFAGLLPSLIVVVAYNWLRYESILPIEYMDEGRLAAPPLGVRPWYFFWQLFSPNGGLIAFWSASLLALLVILAVGRRQVVAFAWWSASIIILLYAAILSNWWTPFGWDVWGHRLIIPVALFALYTIAGTTREAPLDGRVSGSAQLPSKPGKLRIALWIVLGAITGYSLLFTSAAYSVHRTDQLELSLWGSDACKAVALLRDKRSHWEFKKTPLHLQCHFDRFLYYIGRKADLSPIAVVDKGLYSAHVLINSGFLGEGWSHFEPTGPWSKSNRAEIRFVPTFDLESIVIRLEPFVHETVAQQRVIVQINGEPARTVALSSPGEIIMPIAETIGDMSDQVVKIILVLPDAVSPAEVGYNNDPRRIAVRLQSIKLE